MALPALFLCCCAYVLPMRAPPGALAHVSATQVVMKNLDTFDELAGAVKSYLSTIEPAALNDPEAPSPLAYLELRNAGRTDLVEGIMKHGGYFAVSKKLGVRVKDVVAPPPKVNPWTSQLVEEKPDVAVSLSASAKEDKMAADLARLASGTAASAVAPSSTVVGVARGDQLTPIPVRRSGATSSTMPCSPSWQRWGQPPCRRMPLPACANMAAAPLARHWPGPRLPPSGGPASRRWRAGSSPWNWRAVPMAACPWGLR